MARALTTWTSVAAWRLASVASAEVVEGSLAHTLGEESLLFQEALAKLSLLGLLGLADLVCADWCKERFKVSVKIVFTDDQVELEEVEELLLHEVDFGQAESKAIVALDSGVTSPVLVLW